MELSQHLEDGDERRQRRLAELEARYAGACKYCGAKGIHKCEGEMSFAEIRQELDKYRVPALRNKAHAIDARPRKPQLRDGDLLIDEDEYKARSWEALSDEEREDARKRQKAKQRSIRSKEHRRRISELGFQHSGMTPFGFRRGPKHKDYGYRPLVEQPDEAEYVKLIYKWYLSGRGFKRISRMLNERGVTTRRGGSWSMPQVRRIITNPVYIGKVVYKGETFEGQHDGIVPLIMFNKAQKEMRERYNRCSIKNGSNRFKRAEDRS